MRPVLCNSRVWGDDRCWKPAPLGEVRAGRTVSLISLAEPAGNTAAVLLSLCAVGNGVGHG